MDVTDCSESTTITFEWTLKGLKNLFELSKSDVKSKVTKSPRFGGSEGKWQILFYASGGSSGEGGGHCSLYLSCEPTQEERDAAVNGKWVREGQYNFRFELKPLNKNFQFNSKEAHSRSFSSKTANLGWAQFAHRDTVYFQAPAVRAADAFTIICTITSCAAPPAVPPAVPRQTVPKPIVDAVGSLLDDPLYSDVEFLFPSRKGPKKIYAASKLLKRAEYFEMMFNSNWAESTIDLSSTADIDIDELPGSNSIEDSDAEDDEYDTSAEHASLENTSNRGGIVDDNELDFDDAVQPGLSGLPSATSSTVPELINEDSSMALDGEADRNVRQKLSHPSSPRGSERTMAGLVQLVETAPSASAAPVPGPRKMRVVVRDASYWTYRAMLHYIYTDSIVFAPLLSSFLCPSGQNATQPVETVATMPVQTPSAEDRQQVFFPPRLPAPPSNSNEATGSGSPKTRQEWIVEWESNNLGRPRPVSAKSMYRLADRLDLRELKDRAFQHIEKSLTVDNVPFETFSTFSAAFDEIRKIQVEYFLKHWAEIRGSDAMSHVWQQIRAGRHPGFEDVWPLIAQNLEFKPRTVEDTGRDVVTEN